MADIHVIAEAIAVVLRTIEGLTVYTEPPGSVDCPAATVLLGPGTYDTTMSRGSDDAQFLIDVYVSSSSPQGMRNLYAYLDGSGAKSIVAKFVADPTIGGAVNFTEIVGWAKPDLVVVSDTAQHYHVEIQVNVGVLGLVP